MIDQFQIYNNRYNLIAEGDKLILALSGGIDSMVLADLLLKAKVEFVAAHCNFHLRGHESDGDDWFVRKFAENRGIQCFVKHFETEKYAAKYGISIEMAARDLRYAWFEQLRQQLGYDKIAVAHHADDQAETFFINLLRGAGLNGLKGMKPQNGVIIRPLLWASREQIRKYAVENHIVWREDHTNVESVYLRNRIRNQLLPVFDELQLTVIFNAFLIQHSSFSIPHSNCFLNGCANMVSTPTNATLSMMPSERVLEINTVHQRIALLSVGMICNSLK